MDAVGVVQEGILLAVSGPAAVEDCVGRDMDSNEGPARSVDAGSLES